MRDRRQGQPRYRFECHLLVERRRQSRPCMGRRRRLTSGNALVVGISFTVQVGDAVRSSSQVVAGRGLVLAVGSSNTSSGTSSDSLLDLLADGLLVLLGPVELLSSNTVDFLLGRRGRRGSRISSGQSMGLAMASGQTGASGTTSQSTGVVRSGGGSCVTDTSTESTGDTGSDSVGVVAAVDEISRGVLEGFLVLGICQDRRKERRNAVHTRPVVRLFSPEW